MNISNIDLLKEITIIFLPIIGTILGTILGYIASKKTLDMQLKHDSIEKDKERKLSTKKQIYLEAVENFSKANSYLGSLSNIDLTTTNIYDGFQNFFISTSKICLIAEKKTVKDVSELETTYQAIIFDLMPKLFSLNTLRNKLKIENELYNKSQKELDRIIIEMRQNSESLNGNHTRFELLNKTFVFEQEQSKEYQQISQNTRNQINNENLEFAKKIVEKIKKISKLTNVIFYDLREELEIDTDIKYFDSILEQQGKIINKNIDNCLNFLSNLTNSHNKQ